MPPVAFMIMLCSLGFRYAGLGITYFSWQCCLQLIDSLSLFYVQYGGGRTIRPGQVLESSEEKAAKEAQTRKLLSEYKTKMGLNIDPKIKLECEKVCWEWEIQKSCIFFSWSLLHARYVQLMCLNVDARLSTCFSTICRIYVCFLFLSLLR